MRTTSSPESLSSATPSSIIVPSVESAGTFLPPPPRDPDVRFHDGKTFRRNFITRNKRARTAWYWDHGVEWEVEELRKLVRYWVCRLCTRFWPIQATGSEHIINHLKKLHRVKNEDPELQEPDLDIRESMALATAIAESSSPSPSIEASKSDILELKKRITRQALVNWVTHNHIPYREVQTLEFRLFCQSLNSNIDQLIPKSPTTVRDWIFAEFQDQQASLTKELASARSSIHLSFDMWSSRYRRLGVLGIVAHYLTPDHRKKATLLALRRLQGTHSGENIAEIVNMVLRKYQIDSNLGLLYSRQRILKRYRRQGHTSRIRPLFSIRSTPTTLPWPYH
jgi:hypothetical protein